MCGSQLRVSRLVLAWVRMCTSSPMAMPWAATCSTSSGPARSMIPATAGPATSTRKRSRAIAASVSRPNQATSPGPWLTGANAVVPASRLVTTSIGWDGPMALAIGTTAACSLAAASVIPPPRSSWSAAATSPAQPSATTAARIERRSGSQCSA